MKTLFKNTSEITKDGIIKFNYFNLWNNKFLMIILLYMPVVWTISGIGMFIKNSDSRRLIISLIISIAWLALIFLPPYLSVKMKYKTEDYDNTYEFFEDKLSAENKFAKEEIYYTSLYKVYETKRYFYFYINKKSALIVKKDNFDLEKIEVFTQFLKEKLNKRYKRSIF